MLWSSGSDALRQVTCCIWPASVQGLDLWWYFWHLHHDIVILFAFHLATCKAENPVPKLLGAVNGAFVAWPFLCSQYKGPCKPAEDYHEHCRAELPLQLAYKILYALYDLDRCMQCCEGIANGSRSFCHLHSEGREACPLIELAASTTLSSVCVIQTWLAGHQSIDRHVGGGMAYYTIGEKTPDVWTINNHPFCHRWQMISDLNLAFWWQKVCGIHARLLMNYYIGCISYDIVADKCHVQGD